MLQEVGFTVEQANPRLMYFAGRVTTASHDFFGAFDLWAIGKNGHMLLLQCTISASLIAKKRRLIEALPFSKFNNYEIWERSGKNKQMIRRFRFIGGQGWTIQWFNLKYEKEALLEQ